MANRGTYIPFLFIVIIRRARQKLIEIVAFSSPPSYSQFAILKSDINRLALFQPGFFRQRLWDS